MILKHILFKLNAIFVSNLQFLLPFFALLFLQLDIKGQSYAFEAPYKKVYDYKMPQPEQGAFVCDMTLEINNPGTKLCLNATATIDAIVSNAGISTYTFQWQVSNDSISWTNIAGETNIGFTIPSTTASTKYYRVVLTTNHVDCGIMYSVGRKVTVGSFPGCDCIPQSCNDFSKLNFTSNTKITDVAGLVGDRWRFPNILAGYDAIVEVVTAVNVDSLNNIDNTAVNGNDWCPEIYMNYLSGQDSYLDWRITIVAAGTFTPANLPKSSRVSSYDVDGNLNYREIHGHINTNGYMLNDPTELSIAQEGAYSMVLGSNLEHASISTHPEVKATFYYPGQNNVFNIRLGVRTTTGGSTAFRQFAVSFDPCISYSKPDITPLTAAISGIDTTCVGGSNQNYTTTQPFVSYVWAVTGGTIVSGQGTRTINVDWTATGNQTVSVTTTDANGCTSNTVWTVSIRADPSVSATATGASICVGGSATLNSAVSNGAGATTYQWQSSTNNSSFSSILGATSATYPATTLLTTTYYRVVITQASKGCGTATSPSATIAVNAQPSGSVTATNSTVCVGGSATISAVPTGGTGVFTYQWQSGPNTASFSNISGENSATYIAPTGGAGTTYYRVLVGSNASGCTTNPTTNTTVQVLPDATVTTQPLSFTECVGGNRTLNFVKINGHNTTYQWQSSPDNATWADIVGQNATSMTPTSTGTQTTYYRAIISSPTSGCQAVQTNSVTTTIVADPTVNVTVTIPTLCQGGSTVLTANITDGTGTCTPQWQRNSGSGWSDISGATNAILTTPALNTTTQYKVILSCTGNGCCN
jgi:hypothetical protein